MSEKGNMKEGICPESTIESANRRNFIRKAALATAAVGVGSTLPLLSKDVLPTSSAVSNAASNVQANCLIVDSCGLNNGIYCCLESPSLPKFLQSKHALIPFQHYFWGRESVKSGGQFQRSSLTLFNFGRRSLGLIIQ